MSSIWNLAGVEELDFAATATLLAISARQQSIAQGGRKKGCLDEEEEDDSDNDETEDAASDSQRQIAECSHDALTDKFLNRLAEILAREKSPRRGSSQSDSRHVAATLCLRPIESSPLTILVAKNGGLDNTDRKILSSLQLWLQLVSKTQRPPPTQTDLLWTGDGGLLEYSRGRLWYHITQIKQSSSVLAALAAHAGNHSPLVKRLQCLCEGATRDSTVQRLNDIVGKAYELRCVWNELDPVKHRKALRHIGMLGRLRAAYFCFKSVAFKLEGVSTIELKSLEHTSPTNVEAPLFRRRLARVEAGLQLPANLLRDKGARKYTGSWRPHIHAEMQLLVSLASKPGQKGRIHRYIGVSKKPCFVCSQVLLNYYVPSLKDAQKPFFNVRQNHGKVYPLWTLPCVEFEPSKFSLAFAAATESAYQKMSDLLRKGLDRQGAIAESSAGVTGSVALAGESTTLQKEEYLAKQRLLNPTKADENDDKIVLGPKVKSVAVGVLPVDGSPPTMTHIAFHALPEYSDRRIPESGHDLVPDFHDAWGENQFNRRFREVELRAQERDELNGDYRLYWNESNELPENELPKNETIKRYLGEEIIEPARRFWHGDVFLVRFTEHARTFAHNVYDVPQTVTQCEVWKKVFKQMWADQFLEKEMEHDRYFAEKLAKIDSDKEIILAKM